MNNYNDLDNDLDLDNTSESNELERCVWMKNVSAALADNMMNILMSNKEKGRLARIWLEVNNKLTLCPPSIPPAMIHLYCKASYVDKVRAWAAYERGLTIYPASVGLVGIKNAIAVIVSSGMFHVKRC